MQTVDAITRQIHVMACLGQAFLKIVASFYIAACAQETPAESAATRAKRYADWRKWRDEAGC
jgi:hypothetical protein